jgi:hypothetical protein
MLWIVEPVTPSGVFPYLINRRSLARGGKEAPRMLKIVGNEPAQGEVVDTPSTRSPAREPAGGSWSHRPGHSR